MQRFSVAGFLLGLLLVSPTVARSADLAELFSQTSRSTVWQPTGQVTLPFETFHPQGFAAVGDALFFSSVEIIEPTGKFAAPQDGYDRTPGKGRGHLFKIARDGTLLGQIQLADGNAYHPGGIDYDGRWLWVPVAEYRPDSASIVYRVDPDTLEATEVLRVRDHIGGLVHDTVAGTLNGVSWGSRRFYTWHLDEAGKLLDADQPPSALSTLNPSFYVDYQDCAYAGRSMALCSGLTEIAAGPGGKPWSLGGLDLVDLTRGTPIHQVPVLLWTEAGTSMTRNPVLVEPTDTGLRALFMPEDGRSTIYSYEAVVR